MSITNKDLKNIHNEITKFLKSRAFTQEDLMKLRGLEATVSKFQVILDELTNEGRRYQDMKGLSNALRDLSEDRISTVSIAPYESDSMSQTVDIEKLEIKLKKVQQSLLKSVVGEILKKKEIEKLKKQHAEELQSKITEHQAELSQLRQEAQAKTDEINMKTTEITRIQEQLNQKEVSNALSQQLQNQVNKLIQEKQTLQNEKDKIVTEFRESKNQLNKNRAEFENLKKTTESGFEATRAQLKTQEAARNQAIAIADMAAKFYKTKSERLNQEKAEFNSARRNLEVKQQQLNKLLINARAGDEDAKSRIADAQRQLEEAQKIKEEAQRNISTARQEVETAKAEAETAKAEAETAKAEAETARTTLQTTIAARNSLEMQLKEKTEAFERSSAEFERVKAEQRAEIDKLTQSQIELKRVQEEIQRSQNEIGRAFGTTKAQLEQKLKELIESQQQIIKEKEEATQVLNEKTKELNAVMIERKADKNELNKVKRELNEAQKQLATSAMFEEQQKQKAQQERAKCLINLRNFVMNLKNAKRLYDEILKLPNYTKINPEKYVIEAKNNLSILNGQIDGYFTIPAWKKLIEKTNTLVNSNINILNSGLDGRKNRTICTALEPLNEKFSGIEEKLTQIYEDLSGAVRVYIRPRKIVVGENNINGKKEIILGLNPAIKGVEIIGCGKENKRFDNFYGVFPTSFENINVYSGEEDVYQNANGKSLKIDKLPPVPPSNSPHRGLYGAINQVKDGYSVVVFGYGLSGSGKTYTLLGKPIEAIKSQNKTSWGANKLIGFKENKETTYGILQYALANLGDGAKITLDKVFEQYLDRCESTGAQYGTTNMSALTGKIIQIHGDTNEILNLSKSLKGKSNYFFKNEIIKNYNYDKLTDQSPNAFITNFKDYILQLTIHRFNQGRIKQTPNNDESSRSHLYLVFKIKVNNKEGYLTIVDMAGRENPFDIFLSYFQDFRMQGSYHEYTLNGKTQKVMGKEATAIADLIKPKLDKEDSRVKDKKEEKEEKEEDSRVKVIKEGFYINETINHLKYYFLQKVGITMKIIQQPSPKPEQPYLLNNTALANYNPDITVFTNPTTELKKYSYYKKQIAPSHDCLMIPVLQYLEGLGKTNNKESKPAKFIMLCCVRPGKKYCQQTSQTLEFASSIKSS